MERPLSDITPVRVREVVSATHVFVQPRAELVPPGRGLGVLPLRVQSRSPPASHLVEDTGPPTIDTLLSV